MKVNSRIMMQILSNLITVYLLYMKFVFIGIEWEITSLILLLHNPFIANDFCVIINMDGGASIVA